MDCLSAILRYILKKGGVESNVKSVEELFFNDHSFLDFVRIIFQIEEIPGIKKKAYSVHYKYTNIIKALNVILEKNPEINNLIKSVDSAEERIEFIKIILTKKCYKMSYRDILIESGLVLNTKFNDISEITNPNFLIKLLSKLTGKNNEINKNAKSGDAFNKVKSLFQESLIPLVINESSFNVENNLYFSIQVQIIFEIFSERITEIRNSLRLRPKNILLTDFSTKIEITDSKNAEIKQFYMKKDYDQDENGHGELSTNIDLSLKDWYPEEVRENEALLLTIGYIAQELRICSLDQCKSFEFTLYNNFIPLFVMRYLNIEKIDNLKKIKQPVEGRLTYQEIKNIKIIIEYLKGKDKSFDILMLDFDSPHLFIYSAKLFFKHFLNTYFVRQTRIDMMKRCHNLLGSLDWYTKPKLYTERRYDTFSGLLTIINPKCEKNDENGNHLPCFCYSDLKNLFKITKVPMVCGIDIMDELYHDTDLCDSIYYQQSDKELPNSIIYQFQFIFNKIDSLPSLSVVELLRLANHKLNKINVIQFDLIKTAMKLKTRFVQLKSKIKRIDQKELDEMKKNQKSLKSNETKIKTFDLRKSSPKTSKKIIETENNDDESNNQTNIEQKFDEEVLNFWNLVDSNYKIDDNILYSKSEHQQSTTEIVKQLKLQEKAIKKEMNFKKDKSIRKKTLGPEEQSMNILLQMRSLSYSFESRLYKLFYYDEEKQKWIFDSDTFSMFLSDKKINIEGSRTPVIFYFNSCETDLIKINTNFIMGVYPKLDQDQIFVYAFCDKHLSKLTVIPDFVDVDKMATKPIFLLLHIPKEKQKIPYISTIIKQIHIFLNSICDLTICLYSSKYIKDQIEMLNEIISTSNHTHKNNDEKNIFLLKNNPNAKYNYEYDKNVHQLSLLNISEQQKVHFYFVDFENFESYKPFIDQLIEFSLKSKTTFSDVTQYFNNFNISHFSGMYFHIYKSDSWKNELKKIIEQRFLFLKSKDSNFDKNPNFVLKKLQKECSTFLPLTNEELINEYILNFTLMRKTFTKQNDDFIKTELQKSSEQNLSNLQKLLNDQDYISKNQLDNMIDKHVVFLKKEYFSIIKAIADEKIFGIIYQDNLDVLHNQIANDKKKITGFAETLMKNFEKKNTINKVDINQAAKRGTNYALKEVENLRESKVCIQSENELEDEIKQDF